MQFPNPKTNLIEFFQCLKKESEQFWENTQIDKTTYGFQIQPHTKRNPGLLNTEIHEYERKLGFSFPKILKTFLKVMNGTKPESINIFGDSGEPPTFSPGYYVYPKDLPKIKEMIQWIMEENKISVSRQQSEKIPMIFPLTSHRFLIVDETTNFPVLSMYGSDIIAYASDLPSFLINDIFYNHQQEPHLDSSLKVKFWLE
jgi:hypothetical protein